MNGRVTVLFWLRLLRRLAVGAMLVYVAVALTWGGTTLARPVFYGLVTLWCGGLVLAMGRMRRDTPARTVWWEVLASNVALALVLGELSLQGYAALTGRSLLLDAGLDAHRLKPGHDYGDGLVGNRLGYPGPELPAARTPGVVRIAALGDSFAVGPVVPFSECYLTRLTQELPGIEVGNFGVSGTGPREYRLILERDVWAVQPDVVLLSIFVGNDITETIAQPRHMDPRQHAQGILGLRGWRLLRECWRETPRPAPAPRSRVGQPGLSPQTFREVEARRLIVCIQPVSAAMEKNWQHALDELERIVVSCHNRQVRLAAVLIPDEFQVNETILDAALAEARLQPGQLDLEGPQRRLAEFFALRQVPCLDLLPALRQAPRSYEPCDTHWNVLGNHVAAREIAIWLSREGIVRRGPG
jgi:hypothetical protein